MSLKDFCDICQIEIIKRGDGINVWSNPSKSYCKNCWTDIKNSPKIHEVLKDGDE
jgi:hypothetical protein